ncbi:MAG: site-2 protease family protein [Aristaeellaceae bacterium]
MFFHTMMQKIHHINWYDLLMHGLHFIVSYWFCQASGLTEQCAGLSLWTFFAYLLLADLLDTAIHELGHVVMGLLTGWRLRSLTIFCFHLERSYGRFTFRLVPLRQAGSCGLFPREEPDLNTSALATVAGGPCATLLTAMLLTPVINAMQPSPLFSFLCILQYLCTLSAILNLIPATFQQESMVTDGMHLLQWMRCPAEQFHHAASCYALYQDEDELPEAYCEIRDDLIYGEGEFAAQVIDQLRWEAQLQNLLQEQPPC